MPYIIKFLTKLACVTNHMSRLFSPYSHLLVELLAVDLAYVAKCAQVGGGDNNTRIK